MQLTALRAAADGGRYAEHAMNVGPQYEPDDPFKAAARLHQSRYRAAVLQVDYCEYGNRLTEVDGRALLNYYDGLGVRSELRRRYPRYSKKRDADMLRSEHIPFNMLAPLVGRPGLTRLVLGAAFGLDLGGPYETRLEWAPEPADSYLGDRTSFDSYVQGVGADGELVGVGIEVKYTERGYRLGASEAARVRDLESTYWATTRESGLFAADGDHGLAHDDLRQIWRNHILGLAMVQRGDIAKFVSVILYPAGNEHFTMALHDYKGHLVEGARASVRGCTFEDFVACLEGDAEVDALREYLAERYLVRDPHNNSMQRTALRAAADAER